MILEASGKSVLVDAEDYHLVSCYAWHITGDGYVQSYLRGSGRKNQKSMLLHRFLLWAGSDEIVDHINHDLLDNRRANLRIVDASTNQFNRKGAQSNSQSGIRNVTFVPSRNKPSSWRVIVDYKGYHLEKWFKTREKAAIAAPIMRKKIQEMAHARVGGPSQPALPTSIEPLNPT